MSVMDEVLMALQAPNRREILRIVSRGERSAGEIHRALGGLTFGAVSQHLGVLERAGLISRGKDAQYRPCRLESEPLDVAADWIERHRTIWEERFDRLGQHIRTIQSGSRTTGRTSTNTNPTKHTNTNTEETPS